MAQSGRGGRFRGAGILLGLGLGGFFDGIVLHQILQWHHMVSHTDRWPTDTIAGLEANTLADGLFHAGTWISTVVGMFLLWGVVQDTAFRWSTRAFVGLLILGWGIFNVVEGIVDHHILQVHRVREGAENPMLWDIGFLVWGAVMIAVGWYLQRANGETADLRSEREAISPEDTGPIR